jgi:hypothetical protein
LPVGLEENLGKAWLAEKPGWQKSLAGKAWLGEKVSAVSSISKWIK